jgi:aspartate racemase
VTASKRNRIGIVGGVGPYAGLDLMKKVFDHTLSGCDQDHVDVLLFSLPSDIVDRTEYLEGRVKENPAHAMVGVLTQLERAGATVAGIPCNTAHAAPIFDLIQEQLKAGGSQITLLNMIRETLAFIQTTWPDLRKIGILSTTGTYRSRVYQEALESASFEVIVPSEKIQEQVIHPAIYDPDYGIKSRSNPVHPQALENLETGFTYLELRGAEAVILGCTEISMAFQVPEGKKIIGVDPTLVLARALIQHAFPDKLKPL